MNRIVLGTSLAPFNFERQLEAVESWINNGFQVVSCNTRDEIDVLDMHFRNSGIEFVEMEHNAREYAGKPLPYIQDILEIVGERTRHICGYINSDIIISKLSKEMYNFIYEQTNNSLLFSRRNEIDSIEDIKNLNWKIHFDGIDMFLIDKHLIYDFFNDGFFVQSVWDLCILIKCEILGIKIKELMNPITFHKRHSLRWNFETSNTLVTKFISKYFNNGEDAYRKALFLFYNILLEKCEQICFYELKKNKCLFVIEEGDKSTLDSIRNQDYEKIELADNIDMKEEYDYIFYAKRNVVYNKVFCRTMMYIMEEYGYKSIKAGRFFVSKIDNKFMYNELNRNMALLTKINEDKQLDTLVLKKEKSGKKGALYYPVSYEKIDINDRSIVEYIKICGRAYLMPAGVRANEWYNINKYKLGKMKIVGFLDNKQEKIGSYISGLPIYPVDEIKKSKDTYVIIASKYYSEEINQQMSEIISEDRILNASKIIVVDGDGGVYMIKCNDRNNGYWGGG